MGTDDKVVYLNSTCRKSPKTKESLPREDFMKENGEFLFSLSFLGLMGLSIAGGVYGQKKQNEEHQKMYHRATEIADVNGDNIIERTEWAGFYREIGIPFEEGTSNPRVDLSHSVLKGYFSGHEDFNRF